MSTSCPASFILYPEATSHLNVPAIFLLFPECIWLRQSPAFCIMCERLNQKLTVSQWGGEGKQIYAKRILTTHNSLIALILPKQRYLYFLMFYKVYQVGLSPINFQQNHVLPSCFELLSTLIGDIAIALWVLWILHHATVVVSIWCDAHIGLRQ